jgi:hypothetical protein
MYLCSLSIVHRVIVLFIWHRVALLRVSKTSTYCTSTYYVLRHQRREDSETEAEAKSHDSPLSQLSSTKRRCRLYTEL